MTGNELVRALRGVARHRGLALHVESHRGKGSHQMLALGARRSVIPDLRKELRPGTLGQILKNLGVTRAELEHT